MYLKSSVWLSLALLSLGTASGCDLADTTPDLIRHPKDAGTSNNNVKSDAGDLSSTDADAGSVWQHRDANELRELID